MARKESYLLPKLDLQRLNQILNSIGRRLDGIEGGRQSNISVLKTDYETGDLDAEEEVIAAFNATNAKINAIVAALENYGALGRDEK
jgi:hypothetical protein